MEGKIVYFEKPGYENTEEVLRIARQRADELAIKTILVASTRGDTAAKAVEIFDKTKVVAVSHAAGWREPNTQEFTEENRKIVEDKGGMVLNTMHAFSGFIRPAFPPPSAQATPQPARPAPTPYSMGEIMARTLRIFGPGMKVICEITVMAADAGLVRTDEDVIAIAGSSRGADTAVVLKPANSRDFFDIKINEILCKPHF